MFSVCKINDALIKANLNITQGNDLFFTEASMISDRANEENIEEIIKDVLLDKEIKFNQDQINNITEEILK